MQTLRDSAGPATGGRPRRRPRVAIAMAAAGVMIASLAGCASPSLPHLQAQVDDVQALSTCESAYLTAVSGTPVTGSAADAGTATGTGTSTVAGASDASTADALPAMMRYFAARTSADAWTTVAVECTGRFAEGTLRSARASYTAQSLAARLGLPGLSPGTVDYGDVVKLDIDSSTLSALSLAEDRAGFAVEVLAARKTAGATLAISDNHKTAAQRLFTLSGADKDPRRKVYTVDRLVTGSGSIDDPSTGILADTVSVVEMNCAREYLDAIASATGGSDSDATADDTTGSTGSRDAASASDASTAIHASDKTLRWLSRAASDRAWRAFDLGYPTFDAALFG